MIIHQEKKILLTGATGYVGGRLLKALESCNYKIRCLARHPEYLESRVNSETEIVKGDVLNAESIESALEGIDTAYYLVHSMGSKSDFVEEDRRAATIFSNAAKEAGVKRIIYLGGLGPEEVESAHLASRHEVGRLLRSSGVPVVEFRASIIIGSGSLSFEMIRALVEKLPVMITPRWVRSLAQPICIEDVIKYLLEAIEVRVNSSQIVEIGGPDRVSYGDIMLEYAKLRKLKRWIIPVPVLSARLSSLWLGLVTPLYSRVGRILVESLRHDTLAEDSSAQRLFKIKPIGLSKAIERALKNEDQEFAETRWSDALSSTGADKQWGGVRFGSRLIESQCIQASCTKSDLFTQVQKIGGDHGWFYGNVLWKIRAALDFLIGGPGLRRGRRHPQDLAPGDTVDFWRVEKIEKNKLLLLQAEMKVPGRAWLQFEVEQSNRGAQIRQTAIFDPVGLFAYIYWYSLFPMHKVVFSGMLREIAKAAVNKAHDQSK